MVLSSQSTARLSSADTAAANHEESLLVQLDLLEKRNDAHKRVSLVRDRAKAVDYCINSCRRAIGADDVNAALLYVKCLSFVDETERIVSGQGAQGAHHTVQPQHSHGHGRTQPTRHWSRSMSQPSVSSRVHPAPGLDPPPPPNAKNVDVWSRVDVIDRAPVPHDDEDYYYTAEPSPWWRCCGLHSGREAKNRDQHRRDLWNTQVEFFLSCLGFIIGVGNTLRFPSMMYTYGGVFFFPYIFFLCIFGLPLVYMHLCIGQYSGLSASGAFWKMMPMASGIGWALVLLAVPVAIYYNIIVAWGLYYLWYSILGFFTEELPWSKCQPDWKATYSCCELNAGPSCFENKTVFTAAEGFFHYQVLNRTLVLNAALPQQFGMGGVQTHLVVALAVAWILVFLGVFKGIGSIGWAVTLTATLPYLMLFILLLRGLSLYGASDGIRFFLTPDFKKLWDINIWKSAAEQVFYSLGIDAGPLISMASFSRYRNNIYRDAVLLVVLDTVTSFLCGLVIFSFVGFLAAVQHSEVSHILRHDSLYLAFTVYPGVTQFMEWGALWAAVFFFMLIISAIDAEFAWLEMIASSIMNQLGSKAKLVETRILVGLCFFFFLMGIPLCARGGIFIFHSIESLNANWNSFSLSLMQVVAVCFIYGCNHFMDDMAEMLRVEPPPPKWAQPTKGDWFFRWKRLRYFFGPTGDYVKLSWCVFSPFILLTLLLASAFSYQRVTFNEREVPWGYELVAWISMIGPLFVVPVTVVYSLYEARRRGKPLLSVISTKNWRHSEKNLPKQPSHDVDNESNYMYIDPISRVASTKSRTNIINKVVDLSCVDEDTYARAHDRIREWAEQSARSEPLRQPHATPSLPEAAPATAAAAAGVAATAPPQPSAPIAELAEEEEEEEEEEGGGGGDDDDSDLYGRRPGRLRDAVGRDAATPVPPLCRVLSSDDEDSNEEAAARDTDPSDEPGVPRRPTVKRSPLMKDASAAATRDTALNLFGPPPLQQGSHPFSQSHGRRTRGSRDRSRVFSASFTLTDLGGARSSSSKPSSDDRAESAPDRPQLKRVTRGDQHSSGSTANVSLSGVSLSPYNIRQASKKTTVTTMSRPNLLKLKRPKPIGNIPQRPPVNSDSDEPGQLSRASSRSYL